MYQRYASYGPPSWECGALGPPVKVYQWLSEFGAYGQWFEGGAIYYSGGRWRIALGQYGQIAGRMASDPESPREAEVPPDPPDDVADQAPPVVTLSPEDQPQDQLPEGTS